MKDIGNSIARRVALAAVLLGCVLPSIAIDGLWGVNYYAPFALDYNELTRRGVDPKVAIRDDVAHFHRLGLDRMRVHCFDRQISYTEGSDPLDQLSHVFRAPFHRGHAGFLSEEFPQGVCGLESAKVGY